ncbi:hypothetical protein J3R82DRAFT_1852 [Butyriboletus roseoflavus]|nr:hypothetical protein J3R82DRAFT_1852 [Butyriboletus roseoflavus]
MEPKCLSIPFTSRAPLVINSVNDLPPQKLMNQLPKGTTIVPILAMSDKTSVTRMTGGLEMHPLFLSISNIDFHIRMAATSHAWQYVAFMLIPKFETHSDYQSIL